MGLTSIEACDKPSSNRTFGQSSLWLNWVCRELQLKLIPLWTPLNHHPKKASSQLAFARKLFCEKSDQLSHSDSICNECTSPSSGFSSQRFITKVLLHYLVHNCGDTKQLNYLLGMKKKTTLPVRNVVATSRRLVILPFLGHCPVVTDCLLVVTIVGIGWHRCWAWRGLQPEDWKLNIELK